MHTSMPSRTSRVHWSQPVSSSFWWSLFFLVTVLVGQCIQKLEKKNTTVDQWVYFGGFEGTARRITHLNREEPVCCQLFGVRDERIIPYCWTYCMLCLNRHSSLSPVRCVLLLKKNNITAYYGLHGYTEPRQTHHYPLKQHKKQQIFWWFLVFKSKYHGLLHSYQIILMLSVSWPKSNPGILDNALDA